MKRSYFNIAPVLALAGLCLSAYPCAAAEALTDVKLDPLNIKGIYSFEWAGVDIGKMGIEAVQTERNYSVTSDVSTTGIVKFFVRHSSHTTSLGSGEGNFAYTNGVYESNYQTRNKKKYVHMTVAGGTTGKETLVPADNPATRPPVPAALKHAVFDPLAITLQMRTELSRALHDNTGRFSLPLYDGRRLTQVDFEIAGKKVLRDKGRKIPTIMVLLSRRLLAGFTAKELKDYNPKEKPARFYFSDDTRLLPVRAEADVLFGTASATLIKECPQDESCLLGNTDRD
jgi:hypothetical protein